MKTTLYSSDYNKGISQEINCFGDSLTLGEAGNATPYPKSLMDKLFPRLLINQGIGGQKTEQIAARQGGKPIFVTLNGNTFVGSNTISITNINIEFLSTAANTTTAYSSGILAGVHCLIIRTVVSGVETYTVRPSSSSNTAVPVKTRFYPDSASNAKPTIQIFWYGRNDVFFGSTSLVNVPAYIDDSIEFMQKPRRFLTIGILPALTEIIGTANYNSILSVNNTVKANYPNNYIESTPPTVSEMDAINYIPTTQDNIDIANGVFPSGMFYDNVHITTNGYMIIANRIYKKLVEYNWD